MKVSFVARLQQNRDDVKSPECHFFGIVKSDTTTPHLANVAEHANVPVVRLREHTLQAHLIEGVPPLPNHDEINARLLAYANSGACDGRRMSIAMIGPSGEAYCVLTLEGLTEWRGALYALRLSGLRDLYLTVLQGIEYDACFGA